MKQVIITKLIEVLLSMLSPDLLRKAADYLLDIVEDAIEDSETQLDDKVLIPMINAIRSAFDIPDNDE